MTSHILTSANRMFDSRALLLGVGSILAATVFVAYTSAFLVAIGMGIVLLALRWLIPARLAFWQALMAISLGGFIILNYGFENFVLANIAGAPLLIGEILMVLGLLLAIRKLGLKQLRPLLHDPIARCFSFLLAFAIVHLAVDIPHFGLYALRDASMYFEAVFLAAGYLWATAINGPRRFLQCLLVILMLNTVYSFTLPISDSLQSISPKSGVFQPISLFGQYQDAGLYLLAGAVLSACLAEYSARKITRGILFAMSVAQICGLAVIQNRSMYLGIVIVPILLFIFHEKGKLRRFMGSVAWSGAAMLALLSAFSLLGVTIRGRVGEINADFLRQYALSVLSLDDANARLGRDDDRADWLQQAWQNTASDPVTLLTGQGFGKPLIDFENEDGVPVRQPHNAAMAVFGRLGIIGVSVWLLSQVLFFKRFFAALKTQQSPEVHDLILWLLIFYVLAFVMSMVQPSLEFSHYSIPLYFILGFSLKVLDTVLAKSRAKQAFRTVAESRA